MRARTHRIALLALTLLVAAPAAAVCPVSFEAEVLVLVNQERAASGIPPLAFHDFLIESARGHSLDMATNGFFDHTGSDGSSPGDRIAGAGYTSFPWGENIAAGYATPSAVVDAWMGSPGHRANILDPGFDHSGIGYVLQPGSPYGHYWTQNFGGGAAASFTCSDPPGGGGAPDFCQPDQLAAAGRLCKAQLKCWSRHARHLASDTGGSDRDVCLDRAAAHFEKKWDKVRVRAAAAGGACAASDPAASMAATMAAETAALGQSALQGADPVDAPGNRLRARLLAAGATLCGKALAAERRNAKKPDAPRLAERRDGARGKFDDRSARALDRAARKGVAYGGAPPSALGDQAETIADDVSSATQP